ncbi:MAG: diaminopimelate epimerase [Halanaerobiales bacterium]
MKVEFFKMHGLGNDFIILNDLKNEIDHYKNLAKKLCDRHFGIGADGIILIQNSQKNTADFKMKIFNPDGSEAEMCGNGIRCFVHYLHINDITNKKALSIETLAGLIKPEIIDYGTYQSTVKVNMGKPDFSLESLSVNKKFIDSNIDKLWRYPLRVDDKEYILNGASTGNPHVVIYVNNLDHINVKKLGPIIEENPLFKEGTNVEFAEIIDKDKIKLKVWERGAGATLACGTGACATAAVSIAQKRVEKEVQINLPGGPLQISQNNKDELMMTGPSTFVFKGEIITGGI